eukprot:sb/3474305/
MAVWRRRLHLSALSGVWFRHTAPSPRPQSGGLSQEPNLYDTLSDESSGPALDPDSRGCLSGRAPDLSALSRIKWGMAPPYRAEGDESSGPALDPDSRGCLFGGAEAVWRRRPDLSALSRIKWGMAPPYRAEGGNYGDKW